MSQAIDFRKAELQKRLRSELEKLGRHPSRFFETIDGVVFNTSFSDGRPNNADVIVLWGPSSARQKDINPHPVELAAKMDAVVDYWRKTYSLPPKGIANQKSSSAAPPKKVIPLGPSSCHILTNDEWAEYQELKRQAENGIWISNEQANRINNSLLLPKERADEFRYGFVSAIDQAAILKRMDTLLRRMS